ncbi:unnamed protein product [Zymoseptoria tritici ST99CH_3D7]|uniref:BTB domain-containing protein n=1 Tax=Zymoseptoria tritici (strain ST99CH_3D7) TaxID=1276538 RepID=A0A1X7S6D5_ZYMT9|nr:unnamed protein product [Zymoseptoria tritici ST99CH_3D7]
MDDKDSLINGLRAPSQRLIKIFIGGSTASPIQVQQQMLERLSSFFAKALQEDAYLEGIHGVLRFPEDEMDVWEVLIYWMFCRNLPKSLVAAEDCFNSCKFTNGTQNLPLAVRCWTTGDKYGIGDFQDAIMLPILRRLHKMQVDHFEGRFEEPYHIGLRHAAFDLQFIQLAFERTSPGSVMRDLLVDWMVFHVYGIEKEGYLTPQPLPLDHALEGLELLDGTGVLPAMLAKKKEYDEEGESALCWRYKLDLDDDPRWLSFFVAFDAGFDCTCICATCPS